MGLAKKNVKKMRLYEPDAWVIVKIAPKNEDPYYKVAAGWSGGYLHGNNWRTNSGITKVELVEDYYCFYGSSGSVYKCHKDSYGLKICNAPAIEHLQAAASQEKTKIKIMKESTNWEKLF